MKLPSLQAPVGPQILDVAVLIKLLWGEKKALKTEKSINFRAILQLICLKQPQSFEYSE